MAKSDEGKGRADAAGGKYDPPHHNLILPESKQDWEDTERRKNDYDYGYNKEKGKDK